MSEFASVIVMFLKSSFIILRVCELIAFVQLSCRHFLRRLCKLGAKTYLKRIRMWYDLMWLLLTFN
jgi:hypothetical protein